MYKILILALALLVSSFSFSQQISVKSFRILENDLTAQVTHPKIDQNGHKAALIKIVTTQTGFEFEGGMLGIVAVEQKTSEIWVYVPHKAKAITILHPKLGQIRAYSYSVPIEAGRTYEMVLVTGTVETIVKPIEIETQWLVITSDPSEADVYINDQPAGKTPYQNELPVGKYTWRVSKELYLPDAGVVELKVGNQRENIVLKLKPNFGSISIKTNPEVNARLLINGMDVNQTTPCVVEKVPIGNISIGAKVDYYEIENQNINLSTGQNQQIVLKANPTFGTISVSSSPESGAYVTLNGLPTGKTSPCTLDKLSVGEYTISLSRDWYETTAMRVSVEAGKAIPVTINMNPTFAEIDISTEPPAEIYINNERKGNGSWKGRLNPAVYTFEARLDKHTTATEKQTVVMGKPLIISLKPSPKVGSLKIISTPLDAEITLNGKSYGITPITIKDLLIGDYNLTISKLGHASVVKTINIAEGKTTEVNETLSSGMEVTIASIPSGSKFSLNGLFQGNTPKSMILKYGTYKLVLENNSNLIEETIEVIQGGTNYFEFNMTDGAEVTVLSNPLGASITIDGKNLGVTPKNVFLTYGVHSVKLMVNNEIFEETIQVTKGGSTNFNFDISGYSQYIESESPRQDAIGIIIPKDKGLTSEAETTLRDKMIDIITLNGLTYSEKANQFVMMPKIKIISNDITPTAPPMYALNMDITFSIKDIASQSVYSETTISIKGIGKLEEKAYTQAFKNINPRHSQFKSFTENGKKKIHEKLNIK